VEFFLLQATASVMIIMARVTGSRISIQFVNGFSSGGAVGSTFGVGVGGDVELGVGVSIAYFLFICFLMIIAAVAAIAAIATAAIE
jgi:hypothetical protein